MSRDRYNPFASMEQALADANRANREAERISRIALPIYREMERQMSAYSEYWREMEQSKTLDTGFLQKFQGVIEEVVDAVVFAEESIGTQIPPSLEDLLPYARLDLVADLKNYDPSLAEAFSRVNGGIAAAELLFEARHTPGAIAETSESDYGDDTPRGDDQGETVSAVDPEPQSSSEGGSESDVDIVVPDVLQRLQEVRFFPITDLYAIQSDPRLLHNLTGRAFEELIAETLHGLDYEDVVLTPASKDGGVDIYARKEVDGIPIIFAYDCKRYTNKVGLGTMRSLLGAVTQGSVDATVGVLVTTSRFTAGALELIGSEARIRGRDFHGVVDWIKEFSNRRSSEL